MTAPSSVGAISNAPFLVRLSRLREPGGGVTFLGVAAIMYGIACLLQRDFAIYWQPVPESVPFRLPLSYLSAGLLVLGGAGLLIARTVRAAAMILRAGGSLGVTTARIAFGICSILFALAHLIALKATADMVPAWMPGGQVFWAIATGVGHLAVGLALIGNRIAVPATRLGWLMYLTFALLSWLPGAVTHPTQWLRWAGAAISLCMAAALWLVGDLLAARDAKIRFLS